MGFSVIPEIPLVLATSFLASYLALWLELLEAYIDTLYMRFYGKITATDHDHATASYAVGGDSAGSLSDVRQGGAETEEKEVNAL